MSKRRLRFTEWFLIGMWSVLGVVCVAVAGTWTLFLLTHLTWDNYVDTLQDTLMGGLMMTFVMLAPIVGLGILGGIGINRARLHYRWFRMEYREYLE